MSTIVFVNHSAQPCGSSCCRCPGASSVAMDCEAIVVDAMKPLKIAKRPASKTPKQGLVKKTCMKAAAQPTTPVAIKAAMKATKASPSSAIPKHTMGSDCTGYNAAGLAMEAIGVPYEDVFASDISAPVRAVLRENFLSRRSSRIAQHVLPLPLLPTSTPPASLASHIAAWAITKARQIHTDLASWIQSWNTFAHVCRPLSCLRM